MTGTIYVGIGGWTYEPWRGVFYPPRLPHRRELEFASRQTTSIEINGTFYSTFKADNWRRWRDETPDGFVFSIKGSRYCSGRRVLAEAGPSIERFLGQGLTELGPKLGPICWQFAETRRFQATDFDAFLAMLPKERDGVALRHAVEVRNPTFASGLCQAIARRYGVAVVYACGRGFPEIDVRTADFTYARIMTTREDVPGGLTQQEVQALAQKARTWAEGGDVFLYFISGAKVYNPIAARALIDELGHTWRTTPVYVGAAPLPAPPADVAPPAAPAPPAEPPTAPAPPKRRRTKASP